MRTAAALLSTANLLVLVVVGVVLQVASLVQGHVDVPFGYFGIFAGVTVLVLVATWPQSRRVPPGRLRVLAFSLRSGTLLILSAIAALSMFSALLALHPQRTLFTADAWPEWLCIAAATLAYVRLEFDPAPVSALTPLLTRVPDPTRSARILSTVSVSAFLASLALTVVGGLFDLAIPAALLWVQPVVLLAVELASLRRANRWVPTGPFSGLRSVTPIRLALLALASVLVQLPLAAQVSSYYGILVLFAGFLVGLVASFQVTDDGPTTRGKRPRNAAPLVAVGKLPQVEVGPVRGWTALPNRFPTDGYPNATAWATGMMPRIGAEIGTGTDEQKKALAKVIVHLTNTRLDRGMGQLFAMFDEWEGPYLVAGLADEFAQPWIGMPVNSLEESIARNGKTSEPVPLTDFTTATGLEGKRRLTADTVDYYVTVEGGWAHLSCDEAPQGISASLPQLDALASAIFVGNRVVGRRKAAAT